MRDDPMMDYFAQSLIEFIGDMRGDGAEAAPVDLDGPKGLQAIRLFEQARDLTGDDLLGLADAPCPRGSYLFRGEIAVRCTTLGEALELALRYNNLVCPAVHFLIEITDDEAIIELEIDGAPSRIADAQRLWLFITTHRFAQWLIESEIGLNWVELSVPMSLPYGDYAEVFGAKCAFNCDRLRMGFPRTYLQRRVVRMPEDFVRHNRTPLGNIVEPALLSRTWKHLVKRVLRANLDEEKTLSNLNEIAGEFGFSGQTLRRRLKAEKTSYRELKAEVRHEAALDVLSSKDASLTEASFRAGFAEANGLTRAMRSATGMGSSQLREQIEAWQGHGTKH